MKITAVMIAVVALTWQEDPEWRRRALAIVKEVDGTIVIDSKVPGEPVVALNL